MEEIRTFLLRTLQVAVVGKNSFGLLSINVPIKNEWMVNATTKRIKPCDVQGLYPKQKFRIWCYRKNAANIIWTTFEICKWYRLGWKKKILTISSFKCIFSFFEKFKSSCYAKQPTLFLNPQTPDQKTKMNYSVDLFLFRENNTRHSSTVVRKVCFSALKRPPKSVEWFAWIIEKTSMSFGYDLWLFDETSIRIGILIHAGRRTADK